MDSPELDHVCLVAADAELREERFLQLPVILLPPRLELILRDLGEVSFTLRPIDDGGRHRHAIELAQLSLARTSSHSA